MMLKYVIALVVLVVLAAVSAWAFLPARHLPGNRARHLRVRLHLRLHPGKGFAHLFSLWLRWGRFAALRGDDLIRFANCGSTPQWTRCSLICTPRPGSSAGSSRAALLSPTERANGRRSDRRCGSCR